MFFALSLTACQHDFPVSVPDSAAATNRAITEEFVFNEDKWFAQIEEKVPGYGGHFVDKDGALVAYVTDLARSDDAQRELQSRLGDRTLRAPLPGVATAVRVVRGDYSFSQLNVWRNRLSAEVLRRIPGVIWSDLDEGRNRVTIGVDAQQFQSVKGAVLTAVGSLGIPSEALRFEPSKPEMALSSEMVGASLTDKSYEIVGGIRIGWSANAGLEQPRGCTLGFPAELPGGQHAFITASHCSSTKFGTDNTWIYQPDHNQTPAMGYELYDPAPGTCPFAWGCDYYRFSDASLFATQNENAPSHPLVFRRGLLARPASPASGSAGTLAINPSKPYFYVTGTSDVIYQGEHLSKIGSYSGWTTGPVTSTCVTYYPGLLTSRVTRCSYRASIFTVDGDSGGPVFSSAGHGDAVTAKGIVFAKDDNSQTLWFSKWQYVASELGNGGQYTPNVIVPTVTISASISGVVNNGSPQISWNSASVQNASGPTLYELVRNTQEYTCDYDQPWSCWYQSVSTTVYSGPAAPHSVVDSSIVGAVKTTQCTTEGSVGYVLYVYNSGQFILTNIEEFCH